MAGESAGGGPYQFTEADLAHDRLAAGAAQTMADFYQWQAANPGIVNDHIALHSESLLRAAHENTWPQRLLRRLSDTRNEAYASRRLTREIDFLSIHNIGELPEREYVTRAVQGRRQYAKEMDDAAAKLRRGQTSALAAMIEPQLPGIRELPEMEWLETQVSRLRNILPQFVIDEGGIGKVARTIVGVMSIAAYDVRREDRETAKAHLRRVLPASYAFGVTYPIVDDTLLDHPYFPDTDKAIYEGLLLEGLRSGKPIDAARVPDHPLAGEMIFAYDIIRRTYPIEENPNLYAAGETFYLSQARDAGKTVDGLEGLGIRSLYPDMLMKAAMTRTIGNILGRRAVPPEYYAMGININLINQLRDDFVDRRDDSLAGRLTPFTFAGLGGRDTSVEPLYDLMSYDAYVAHRILGGDPYVVDVIAALNAARLAASLIREQQSEGEIWPLGDLSAETRKFVRTALSLVSGSASRPPEYLDREDILLRQTFAEAAKHRSAQEIEPRTFISDKFGFINGVIEDFLNDAELDLDGKTPGDRLPEVERYALQNGKRLRPAMALMLAESLGIDQQRLRQFVLAVELFHTSSLIFDDLPAQDDSDMRRGFPSAHMTFEEYEAQLAGIAMVPEGFGAISKLRQSGFDPETVLDISEYVGSVLGPKGLCRGQALDLYLARHPSEATIDNVIEMHRLKTSTMIEGALVPLMMLAGRPENEIEAMRTYARHAGIAFQLRDDILDAEDDVTNGPTTNIVSLAGPEHAQSILEAHVDVAVSQLAFLPFPTGLLESMVRYFASRTR